MSFAPLYLVNRFFFRIADFFHHWYIDGSRNILQRCVALFGRMDQTFAVRITLRYFWKPLYGDYTIMGHILGFFFRCGRVLIGGLVYIFSGILMLGAYLAWLALPFLILCMAYRAYLLQP